MPTKVDWEIRPPDDCHTPRRVSLIAVSTGRRPPANPPPLRPAPGTGRLRSAPTCSGTTRDSVEPRSKSSMPPRRRHASVPLKLPFRVGEAGLQSLDGSPLAELRIGAVGELLISSADVVDDEVADRLAAPLRVPLLPAGTELLVGVRATFTDEFSQALGSDGPLAYWDGRVVPIRLEDPLELEVRGGAVAKLRPCQCSSPALGGQQAVSMNHAFTLLSERYETDRISHTGNVFRRVFHYDATLRRWRPLEDLRSTVLQSGQVVPPTLRNQVGSGSKARPE